jgi:hypothetical protein
MSALTLNRSSEPDSSLWLARTAQFPRAAIVALAAYNHSYPAKTCYVVGRGPTEYCFEQLRTIQSPIFFINDAVCLEPFATSETFFFAHDASMLVWLDGSIRSTAVLPLDGKLFHEKPDAVLNHRGRLVFYRWQNDAIQPVLRLDRDRVAASAELYRHGATIHALLHFVWYCGFRKVVFIGCDGLNDPKILAASCDAPTGYNSSLENRSETSPWWQYDAIRRIQDCLCGHLGLDTQYLGAPTVGAA